MTARSHFECSRCQREYELRPEARCDCGGSLLVRYDLSRVMRLQIGAELDLWRWAPLLPIENSQHIVSMGEGWTPLVRLRRLGTRLDVKELWLKDESVNPLGTWEARAYSVAVSWAREQGSQEIVAGAGEAAALACAAYAAAGGLRARVRLPERASGMYAIGPAAYGATIDDAAVAEDPMRVEGLKTVAFDLSEQFGDEEPYTVFCPSADGAQAIEKGFAELHELGWVSQVPEVVVPDPIALRDGVDAALEMAALEGVLPCPDTAACLAAVRGRQDRAVVINTASGLHYESVYRTRFLSARAAETDKLGGLITPR